MADTLPADVVVLMHKLFGVKSLLNIDLRTDFPTCSILNLLNEFEKQINDMVG